MNRLTAGQLISFALFIAIQVLLLKNIQIAFLEQFSLSILIYPIIIILLPVSFGRSAIIVSAFAIGLIVDVFYDSPGVHAATLVFTAFIRSIVLGLIEPRLGYRANDMIEKDHYGLNWFLSYVGILLFVHIFIYFSIDAFSFVFILKIFVNTIVSFIVSYLLIILYKLIF